MKILMLQQRSWGLKFGHYFAKRIRAEYPDARLAACVFKGTTMDFIQGQKEVAYEKIWYITNLYDRRQEYTREESPTLAEINRELGIPSIWPLVHADRHMVKDYGKKYFYSPHQQLPDNEIIAVIRVFYHTIREIFRTFPPDLIITPNFVNLFHNMLYHYAGKRNIRMIGITDTKVSGYYSFVYDPYDSRCRFIDRYKESLDNARVPFRKEAENYISGFRREFISPEYLAGKTVENFSFPFFRYLKSLFIILKRFIQGRTVHPLDIKTMTTRDTRSLKLLFRDFFAEKSNQFLVSRIRYYEPSAGEKFVFFPLQFEPEATLDVMAPYFSNQIEVVRVAALSLPGDYTLVVKEHPAMIGKRSRSYYEQIRHMANVKLVSPYRPSYHYIRQAGAVIVITGTTAFEAALLGKPSIMLGDIGSISLLPHIHHITDFRQLTGEFGKILFTDYATPAYDEYLIKYISAVMECGFQINYAGMWEYDQQGEIEIIWRKLKVEIDEALKEARA